MGKPSRIDWDKLNTPEERKVALQALDATDLVEVRSEYKRLRRDWYNARGGHDRYAIFDRLVELFISGYELAWRWHDLPANPVQAVRDDLLAFGQVLYRERRKAVADAARTQGADQVGPVEDDDWGLGDGHDGTAGTA